MECSDARRWLGRVLVQSALVPFLLVRISTAQSFKPIVHPAPVGVEAAAERIARPDGLTVELVAAEPLLANPVAFYIDERGAIYVAETFRHTDGATDNRAHMEWLKDELAAVTVDDRVRMFQRYLPPEVLHRWRTVEDRLRLLRDTDGDGRYDSATVFAGGFHHLADGIGAGVYARGPDVWYTCIPHLWLLRDPNHDGVAEWRRPVYGGFGVHVAFIGHDLHGICLGPDGRLYFSIGDRGFNVPLPDGRRLVYPHTGAVLRCELDGSGLEVVHFGLRNPQELAFNRVGDLFTGDNNSDGGDQARLVQIVDGGNSGWTIGFQYAPEPVLRGMWNHERLWQPAPANQGRHLVPPIANLGNGPSGLVYNPGGTALPPEYDDSFFLCDFRGQIPISGIHRFRLEPNGAGYRLVKAERFLWNVCATDCTFGFDGAFYVLDWVEGWQKPGRGRIYRVYDPKRLRAGIAERTGRLMREGFAERSDAELAELLAYPDQRVRIEASIALAERGNRGRQRLSEAALTHSDQTARLHAVWGLGMQARRGDRRAAEQLAALLRAEDAEIRAQAAKALGEAGRREFGPILEPLILDPAPRVRLHATLAASRLKCLELFDVVLRMLEENADADPYLRHAGVLYLARSCPADQLQSLADHAAPAVRIAAVLALRRQRSEALRRFLHDPDPAVLTEAVRAIYDEPVESAMDALRTLDASGLEQYAQLRILLAHRRHAGPEDATYLARFASDRDQAEEVRAFALKLLANWSEELWQDPILGLYRPVRAGRAADVRAQLLARMGQFLDPGQQSLARLAIRALVACDARQAAPQLRSLVRSEQQPAELRAEALRALGALGINEAQPEAVAALYADSALVRSAAIEALASIAPDMAVEAIDRLMHSDSATFAEKQAALLALAWIDSPEADRIVRRCMNRILRGDVPVELQVELLEVAEQRAKGDRVIGELLRRYRRQTAALDPVERYGFALRGGDAERGAEVFFGNAAVSCLRCHKVRGVGGDVGPDLSRIGAQRDRIYLLRSIVDPNGEIAEGYESAVLLLDDGRIVSGVLRGEDDRWIELVTAEGGTVRVEKARVEARRRGPSAMPADLVEKLTPRELRDLIEFLSRLQ